MHLRVADGALAGYAHLDPGESGQSAELVVHPPPGGAGSARAGHGAPATRAAEVLGARRPSRRPRLRRARSASTGAGCCGRCGARCSPRCRRTGSRGRPVRDVPAGRTTRRPGWRVNARAFAEPPRAGPLDRARPARCARPSRGSTRPASCSPSTARTTAARLPLDQGAPGRGRPSRRSARCTSSASTRAVTAGAGLGPDHRRPAPPARPGPDRPPCCTWTSRTPPPWRSTGGWASRSSRPTSPTSVRADRCSSPSPWWSTWPRERSSTAAASSGTVPHESVGKRRLRRRDDAGQHPDPQAVLGRQRRCRRPAIALAAAVVLGTGVGNWVLVVVVAGFLYLVGLSSPRPGWRAAARRRTRSPRR